MDKDIEIVELVKYNLWANKRLVDWLKMNDDELVLKKCYSSFSTILKTVNHILDGQLLYYSALLKTEYVKFENSLVNESYDELIKQSTAFVEYVENQNTLKSKRLFKYGDLEGEFPQYELIQHCVNHSTYHRGQIITMGHQLEFTKAPSTDMLFYFIMR